MLMTMTMLLMLLLLLMKAHTSEHTQWTNVRAASAMTCFGDVVRTSRLRSWRPKISTSICVGDEKLVVQQPVFHRVRGLTADLACWICSRIYQMLICSKQMMVSRTNLSQQNCILPAMDLFRINWLTIVAVDCSRSRVRSRRVRDEMLMGSCSTT